LRVAHDVTSIIIEGGKAVGVRAVDRRGAVPREVEHRAPVVISDAGARMTYGRLLPTSGALGRRTARLRSFIDGLRGDGSAVTLYLRLKAPVSTIGIKGENVWVNADAEHDAVQANSAATLDGRPRHIYVSFPSAKSGDEKFHTAEIISFVDDSAFAAWKETPHGNRGVDYAALKARIADGLLDLAETAVPGLKALVSYRELSTPLTVEHYTSHAKGRFYGLPAVPERYRGPLLGPVTPVPGLLLSGSDAGCLGIVGSLMGGVAAATRVLGGNGFFRIMAAVRGGRVAPATAERAPEKARAVLAGKRRLAPATWELRWRLDAPLSFAPGQFARLRVAEHEWRDYSIASAEGGEMTLLVSTRTGGRGSRFAEEAALGQEAEIELPLGEFRLVESKRRRVFVATGTGLAPLLPMLAEIRRRGEEGKAELLFGCATAADNLLLCLSTSLPPATRICMSREAPGRGGFHGRVTSALTALTFDPAETDFYLCGSAAMVSDSRAILERAGARYIYMEAY
jgi:NAD(P)H-flavin reductase